MTHKGWWYLILGLLLLSLILRYDLLFLFAILLGLALGASLLWYRTCLNNVTYRRRLRDERVFCGEETELTIEVTNAKPLPLAWLLVRDDFPKGVSLLTGYLGEAQRTDTPVLSLMDMLALRWYERVQRTYRIRSEDRGVYVFGPATLTSGDVFGFGQRSEDVERLDRLVVYPKVVPVKNLELLYERPSGELKASRKVIEDPLRMATVREYVPGDSMRFIHWKNSARLDKLQTKVFDPSASEVLAIFADVQTAPNPYSFVTEYLELIISAAASICVDSLAKRQAVGLYVNGGPRNAGHWTVVPPGRSAGQGMQILEALSPLTGFRLVSLPQLLSRSMPSLPYGSTVLVITARATEEAYVSLLSIQDRGHRVVLLTVGDEVPDVPERFASYHLGGRDAWRRLETLELA